MSREDIAKSIKPTVSPEEQDFPRTAYINGRCINIVARLWNSPEEGPWATGAVALAPGEASMVALVSAWLRWRAAHPAATFPKPNFIVGASHSHRWENLAALWRLEMRTAPEHPDGSLCVDDAAALADASTVAVIATMGSPLTDVHDDVAALARALDSLSASAHAQGEQAPDVPILVDATLSGFILPFTHPELPWDFRTPRVASILADISPSYRMAPEAGWTLWRSRSLLPQGMVYSVTYLGLDVTQVALNFTRPLTHLLDTYAAMVRIGPEGYRKRQLALLGQSE